MFGKSSTFEINLSKAAFLSGGGVKLLLFLTRELSVSSVPSKFSTSLSFLLNSFKFSFSCSVFPTRGVGVNFVPLFNKVISMTLSFLLDKFIVFMSLSSVFITDWRVGFLCPEPDPVP